MILNRIKHMNNIFLDKIITEAVNDSLKKIVKTYALFYVDEEYVKHFWGKYSAKNDKEVLKLILPEIKKSLIVNFDVNDEKTYKSKYEIELVNGEDEYDWNSVYNLTVFLNNGKTFEYSYLHYNEDGSTEYFDSFSVKNEPKFSANICDYLGRTILDIPDKNCKTLVSIKKFITNYLNKQEQNEYGSKSCYVWIYDFKKDESGFYSCCIYDWDDENELRMRKEQ